MRMIVAVMALLSAAAVAAEWRGEFALPPTAPDFVLAWVRPDTQQMREYVPRGETVDRWTRMVTVQQIGYRVGLTPERFLRSWEAGMQRACPDARIGMPEAASLDDHAGERLRIDCGRNPATGLPETVIARAVIGDEGLHVVQAAARRSFTNADLRWANGVLAGTTLCRAAASTGRCTAARDAPIGTAL